MIEYLYMTTIKTNPENYLSIILALVTSKDYDVQPPRSSIQAKKHRLISNNQWRTFKSVT